MGLKLGIIGCGLVGTKRMQALRSDDTLIAVADVDAGRAARLASQHSGCASFTDWRQVVDHPSTDVIIVATTNNMLSEVAMAAVRRGKPVLIEKPAARNLKEIDALIEMSQAMGAGRVPVKVGFNHRFHPSFIKAREIWDSGELGEFMYIRGRYGHGGRIGYDREWRADPKIAGGGELLDQGVHLIDLSRWFAGEFPIVAGLVGTYFWDMSVEDNGFMLLETARRQAALLHVSCTEWKNLFSFEIFGRNGKLQIDGLGGSYGVEKLTYYKMLPEMGPPETASWEYPGADRSWSFELDYFRECIREHREPQGNLHDARAALEIIETLYQNFRREK